MKSKSKEIRDVKGITLIALIVTIIVLIILAGISINLILGENGIITKAKQSREVQTEAEVKEKAEMMLAEYAMEGEFNNKTLLEFLQEKKDNEELEEVIDNEDGTITVELNGYEVTIQESSLSIIDTQKAQGEKPTITGEVVTTGIVAQGEKVEIKVTAGITEGTITSIEPTNGAVLKTDTSTTEKIYEVSTNGTYYFKVKADNGRSATISVEVNTIKEKPEISIKDVTLEGFTIVVNTNYVEGLVTEYKYYVGGVLQSASGTMAKEYVVTGLNAGTKYGNIYVEASFGGAVLASEVKEVTTNKVLVTSITLNKTATTIEKGNKENLTTSIEPSNATDKTFTAKSSDTSIATVIVSGNTIAVTAVAKGRAEITVTANDGSGKSAVCDVVVKVPGEISYSWEELSEVAKVISNTSTITSDTNEVNVTCNGKEYTLKVGETTKLNGKNVRILGFNHDKLRDTAAYGGNNTYAGISFEYVSSITSNSAMNSSDTNTGGWGASSLRIALNGTLYNSIKGIVNIKQVQKAYCRYYNSATLWYSNDYLWLLSCAEIWNNGYKSTGKGYSWGTEGTQYKYYKNINATFNVGDDSLKKVGYVDDTNVINVCSWWLRSPYCNDNLRFCQISTFGTASNSSASALDGVFPGFSI